MRKHLFALVLLTGCTDAAMDPGAGGGGGKGDGSNVTFGDQTTAWELVVGYAGDAVVNDVTPVDGGGMFAKPDAVAAVVAMLASSDAYFVTGTEVRVDGGTHM